MGCGCNDCRSIELLTGQTGQNGANGMDGVFGGNSDKFVFNGLIYTGNPTSTKLLINNADVTAATAVHVSYTDFAGADVTAWLTAAGVASNAIKGFIRISKEFDSTAFVLYSYSGVTLAGGYASFIVSPLPAAHLASSSASPFTNGDNLVFSYVISGDIGTNGSNARTTLFNNLSSPSVTGNTGGLTTLITESIPAGRLANDGDSVCIQAEIEADFLTGGQTTKIIFNFVIDSTQVVSNQFTSNGAQSSSKCIINITMDRVTDFPSGTYLLTYVMTNNGQPSFVNRKLVSGADFTNQIPVFIEVSTNNNDQVATCKKLFAEYKPI